MEVVSGCIFPSQSWREEADGAKGEQCERNGLLHSDVRGVYGAQG